MSPFVGATSPPRKPNQESVTSGGVEIIGRTDHVECCRLASAVRTKQSQHVTLSNSKGHAINHSTPVVNLCYVDNTERVLGFCDCVRFSNHICGHPINLWDVVKQGLPRTPSLERQNCPRIPPDEYAEEDEAGDDKVEDRSTISLHLSQAGCRDGFVPTTQKAKQADGYKGGPCLANEVSKKYNTSQVNEVRPTILATGEKMENTQSN